MAEPSPEIAGRVAHMSEMAEAAWEEGLFFFYIRIPENLTPFERGDKYEDPLIDILKTEGLGEVTGGGQQLGEGNTILYCGIDVVLKERTRGLKLLRDVLPQLGAPTTTVIEEFVPTFIEHSLEQPNI